MSAVEVEVVFNEGALHQLLEGPSGPTARMLVRAALKVEAQAKVNASGRPGPNVQTGRLRSSITYRIGTDESGLFALIGSNVEYAGYVELGTDRAPPYPYLRPALSALHGA